MASIALYKIHVDCRAVYTTPSAAATAVTMSGVAFGFPDGTTRIALDGTATHTPVFDYTHFSVPYGSVTCYFLITNATWINSACWEIEYRLDGAMTGWSNRTALGIGSGILTRSTDTTLCNKFSADPQFPVGSGVTLSTPVLSYSAVPTIVVVIASLSAGFGAVEGMKAYTLAGYEYAQFCRDTAGDDNEAPYRQSIVKGIYLMYGVTGGTAAPIPYTKPDGTAATFTASGGEITSGGSTDVTMAVTGTDFTNASPFSERFIYIPSLGWYTIDTTDCAVTSSVGVHLSADPVNGVTAAFTIIDGVVRYDLPLGVRHAPTLPVVSSTLAVMKVENDIAMKQNEIQTGMDLMGVINPAYLTTGAAGFAGLSVNALSAAVNGYDRERMLTYAYSKRTAAMSANINGGGGGYVSSVVPVGYQIKRELLNTTTAFWNARGCLSGKMYALSSLTKGSRHWIDLSTALMGCSRVIAKRIIDDFADGIYIADT